MQVWQRAIVLGALVAASSGTALAQRATFRSATELVNLNVIVVGAEERHVPGLTRDHFEVFEDGVPQALEFFAPDPMPLDVVVLLDTSASMTGSMPLVREAASRFVRALGPDDRASIMGISSGLRILQPLTADAEAAVNAITRTRAAGRTPLYISIYTALRELEKIRLGYDQPRRQALVVLSDGLDTASGLGFEDVLGTIRRHGMPIYTIAPRPTRAIRLQREIVFGESMAQQDFELRRLAAETGARAFFPVTLDQLAGVYDDIARELAHQYALGYQSSNEARDGSFRRIGLRVRVPGVTWRTRAGYLAESDGDSRY